MSNRVTDRRHRWRQRHFSDSAQAKGVLGIRHLDNNGVDHWHIGSNRHPVVEKSRGLKTPIRSVHVFLVERPANALHRGALELTFHLRGTNRFSGVLDDRVAFD